MASGEIARDTIAAIATPPGRGGIGIVRVSGPAVAAIALYARGLQGGWRRTYAITAMLSFYLLIFVLIAQLFLKVPALNAMAPTQAEPPFAIAQALTLMVFLVLTVLAAKRSSGSAAPLRAV